MPFFRFVCTITYTVLIRVYNLSSFFISVVLGTVEFNFPAIVGNTRNSSLSLNQND